MRARRANLDAAYGLADDSDLLPWSHVTQAMTAAKTYWLGSVDAAGAPHNRPFDGNWFDDALYFSGSPKSVWFMNLKRDPNACIHLESGTAPVILHGRVHDCRPNAGLAEQLAQASNAKYGNGQSASDYQDQQLFCFTAHKVFAWTLLYRDATCWELE